MVLCMALMPACQPTDDANQTPMLAPTLTPDSTRSPQPIHLESTLKGVRLGLDVPAGWEWRTTDEGILLAEKFAPMEWGNVLWGMQTYCFVRALTDFPTSDAASENTAWSLLKEIIETPSYIGRATVSEPQGFDWDNHDAAYYLLNTGDGNLTMLVAVILPQAAQVVVCNFSSPAEQAAMIRKMLPVILQTLEVDGQTMNPAVLDTLPDPLEFPDAPEGTPEATAEATIEAGG